MIGLEGQFNPGVLLAMWSAGVMGATSLVSYWRIAGRGYLWLSVATATLTGVGAWYFDPDPVIAAALLAGLGAGMASRKPKVAAAILAVSAVLFLFEAAVSSSPAPALTGSLALGGITAQMLLGHWYLVDPRIPRRPLQGLAAAGAAGVALDTAVVLWLGLPLGGSTLDLVISLGLAAVSFLLMVAVWFALRHPSYPGVMAATGLGYLAVLTSLGSVSAVRVLAVGSAILR